MDWSENLPHKKIEAIFVCQEAPTKTQMLCFRFTSLTYLEYFGTFLEFLPNNPRLQHSDKFPANPSWIPDIPRHHLSRN